MKANRPSKIKNDLVRKDFGRVVVEAEEVDLIGSSVWRWVPGKPHLSLIVPLRHFIGNRLNNKLKIKLKIKSTH